MRGYLFFAVSIFLFLPVLGLAQKQSTEPSLPSLVELNAQLQKKDYAAIVRLLAPHEFDFSGDVKYDLIFGQALFEEKSYDQASLVLERVVSVSPQLVRGHMLLASAYENLGYLDRALEELRAADSYATTSNELMAVGVQQKRLIDKLAYGSGRNQFGGNLEGRLGWTSNSTNGPKLQSYNAPGLGVGDDSIVLVDKKYRQQSDTYYQVLGNMHYRFNITPHYFAMLSLNGDRYKNRETGEGNTNYQSTSGVLDLGYEGVKFAATLSGISSQYYLYSDTWLRWRSIFGSLKWRPNLRSQVEFTVQQAQKRYQKNDDRFWTDEQDGNRTTVGIRYSRAFGAQAENWVYWGLNGGGDRATRDRPDGNSKFFGTDFGYSRTFQGGAKANNYSFYARGAFSRETYEKEDLYLLTKRRHNIFLGGIGLIIKPFSKWNVHVIPALEYINDDSNIAYRKYSRWDAIVRVRWAGDIFW